MAAKLQRVRVWDLPTRLFHWVLVLCVIGLVITGHVGGNALEWHFRLGYTVCTLVVFRVVWGLFGGRWSRFSSFVRGPGAVLAYLRGQGQASAEPEVGHNPLGALSVLALLLFLALQVATGLVADDEIASTGPLNKFVSNAVGLKATSYHKDIGQFVLLSLVGLHIAAIAFYKLRKGIDLVRPMLIGDKLLPAGVPPTRDDLRTRGLALALVAVLATAVAWMVSLGG